MRKAMLILSFLFTVPMLLAQSTIKPEWQAKIDHDLPLLGHRNWILIVDSAYPLESSPGVETMETNADLVDVVRYVMGAINSSIHVRPDIFMDAELPYVQEEDAPGTSAYRDAIAKQLDGQTIESELHEKLIARVDEESRLAQVLVLKTRLAVPYSSVFIRLNCKYWGNDAEERLRSKMGPPEPGATPNPEQPATEPGTQPGTPPVPQPLPAQPAPTPPGGEPTAPVQPPSGR